MTLSKTLQEIREIEIDCPGDVFASRLLKFSNSCFVYFFLISQIQVTNQLLFPLLLLYSKSNGFWVSMLKFCGVFWHMLFGDAILDLRMRKVIADEHGIDPTGTLDHVL